jgi:hypothetical protein
MLTENRVRHPTRTRALRTPEDRAAPDLRPDLLVDSMVPPVARLASRLLLLLLSSSMPTASY